MSHLSFWILTCLLGWTALQAENALDSSEAHCGRPSLSDYIDDDLVPYEPIFAFVYNDNAATTLARRSTAAYLVETPIIFNSPGLRAEIVYDRETGELIIPINGSYEITYSIAADRTGREFTEDEMALAINGKLLEISTQRDLNFRNVSTATIVLSLTKGDRVSLILPTAPRRPLLFRNRGVGNSASLFIKKL
jgi:hypothetical protein